MDNKISTYRARLFNTDIVIYTDSSLESTYQLENGEQLIFGLKGGKERTNYIVKKVLTSDDYNEESGGYSLSLSTTETDVPAGLYYYDVALKRSDSELEWIIGTTEFEIKHSIVLPMLL